MKIGVLDSGIGGEALAESIRNAFPHAQLLVIHNHEHMPYGERTQVEVQRLTNIAIQPLLEQQCYVIVIACNTAIAVAIEWLRKKYPLAAIHRA